MLVLLSTPIFSIWENIGFFFFLMKVLFVVTYDESSIIFKNVKGS